jgi:hypothetical protein
MAVTSEEGRKKAAFGSSPLEEDEELTLSQKHRGLYKEAIERVKAEGISLRGEEVKFDTA